jgi:lauroyl/myristoyl acyltransferase
VNFIRSKKKFMLYNYFSVLFVFEALFAGVSGGKVVCAFQPSKCEIMEEGPEKGRKRFGCTEEPLEILKKITKGRRKVLKKFGQGSAVAYLS